MRKIHKLLLAGLCLCMLLTAAVSAASLTTVDITQTTQEGSTLHVYFRAEDENEDPISDLTSEDVELQMGGQVLEAEMAADSSEGTGYVFAVDISRSLSDEQFSSVKEALTSWVSSLGENDQMALVSFGTEITTVADFTADASELNSAVESLALTDDYTRLYGGIERAVDIANRQSSDLPTQRVVVVISDCMEDYEDSSGIAELQDRVSDAMVPLVILGIDSDDNQDSLNAMLSVVRVSGGQMFRYDKDSISQGFDDLQSFLNAVCHLTASIPEEFMDGAEHGVVLTVSYMNSRVDDGLDVRIKSEAEQASGTDASETDISAESYDDYQVDTTFSYDTYEADVSVLGSDEPAVVTATDASATDASASEETGGSNKMVIIVIAVLIVIVVGGVAAVLIVLLVGRKGKKEQKPVPYYQSPQNGSGYGTTEFGGDTEATVDLGALGSNNRTVSLDGYNGAGRNIVLTDRSEGRSYTVPSKTRITIGRAEDRNDIVLRDQAVSGAHAELIFENGVMYVRDCNSHNGTFVISNGIRTQADSVMGVSIQQGDEISVGRTRLEVTQI